ncbi:MAG: hypothetical protein HN733_07545 [Gammaproteobacteria bacterium]|jgi:hypothetical protein|nr:hypothetical protein [Gammaproteobacteria bacterium]
MRKLLTLSLLLLFSVDVFAQDEYCFVKEESNIWGLSFAIEDECKKGQLLWAEMEYGKETVDYQQDVDIYYGTYLAGNHCDFRNEIIIKRTDDKRRLIVQCIINGDKRRRDEEQRD